MINDNELNARTMRDLILPVFELINSALLPRNFKLEWIKEPERHEIKFTGPNGEDCKFSASAETRRKTPEDAEPFPVVVFNWRRGGFRTSNNAGERFDKYTPRQVLAAFEMIFLPWFR